MDVGLKIHDLGPLAATNDEGQVALGTRKERQLLAVLVIEAGRLVSSDRLIDCLWGDSPPSKPLVSLRSYASNLRKALGAAADGGAYLESQTGGYLLRVVAEAIDSARFENALGQARDGASDPRAAAALLDDALTLVRGAPLPDMAYDDFAQHEIGRLTELVITGQELRARLAIDLGDSAAWLAQIADMVATHPLREAIRALHMEALYRTGRQAEALRSYTDHRELLVEELGIDPSPELQSLEARILSQDLPSAPGGASAADEQRDVKENEQAVGSANDVGRGDVAPTAGRPTPLFGRTREIAALTALSTGAPGAAVVVGPSGSGKSAVMAAFVSQMAEQGWRVARGMCHDDEGVPPLWPWREVLRDLDIAGTVAISAQDEFGRFDLFDELASELLEVAGREKVLVALEDLQWADADSLTLLSMIMRRARTESFVVVATSRSAELALPTASFSWVEINPLETGAIVELVESITETVCGDDLAERLLERTGGNAYFVSEIARLARQSHRPVAADDDLPAHLVGLVRRRLEGLQSNTIELLEWATLELHNFSVEVLAAVTGQTVESAKAALQPALDVGLVTPDRSAYARYRFDHDITRESMAGLVDPMVVAQRHLALGEVIEALPSSAASAGNAASLSRHFSLAVSAGGAAAAIRWATQAATEAVETGSHGEALVHLRRAVAAQRAAAESDAPALCRLLIAIGESARVTADAAEGLEALFEAFRLAQEAGDRELMGAAALSLTNGVGTGRFRMWWDAGPAALQALSVATKAAGDNLPLKARLTAQLGADSYRTKPDAERQALAAEAVMLARNSGDDAAIASVLLTESAVSAWSWEPERKYSQAMEALEIVQRQGLEDFELRVHQYLIGDAIGSGAIDDAMHWYDHLRSRAQLVGTVGWRFSVTQWSMMLAQIRGDWELVHELAADALDPVRGYGDYFATAIRTQLSAVTLLQGDGQEAEAFFRNHMPSPVGPRLLLWVLALDGRHEEGRELAGRVDLATRDADAVGGLFSLAPVAEALAEFGMVDLVETLLDGFGGGREQPIIALSGRGGMTYLGSSRYFLGRALTALGRYEEAEQELQLARRTMESLQSPPFILQVDYGLALLSRARDGSHAGASALGAVQDRAIALGMKSYASMAERALAAVPEINND